MTDHPPTHDTHALDLGAVRALIAQGWTPGNAVCHVEGACDRAVCPHPDHTPNV